MENINMYNKLIGKFENQLVIYINSLKEKAESKAYTNEELKLLFEVIKEEWRIFDNLITKMFFYDLITEDEYSKVYEDGYKKYKEYFNIGTKIIINR